MLKTKTFRAITDKINKGNFLIKERSKTPERAAREIEEILL